MLTVSELATKSGTTPYAVRYYTRMGLLRPERHPDNGYRLYEHSAVVWLRFVRSAKGPDYTLSEIREIMHDADDRISPCPRVREILKRRSVENRRRLEELVALQTNMEMALLVWADKPDGVPDGHTVCHLIESLPIEHPAQ